MSSNKNSLRGILRRALAQLLAFLMVFGLAVSGLGVKNAYATELPNDAPTKTAGKSTAVQWMGGRFDLHGLEDPNNPATNHYIAGIAASSKQIRTTFSDNGYTSYLATSRFGSKTAFSSSTNGGVMKVGAVEWRMRTEPSPDGQYIMVDYWLYNDGTNTQTYYLGTAADTCIGNDGGVGSSSPADSAVCDIMSFGFRMVNDVTKQSFYCYTSEPTTTSNLGITEPTYKWVGQYSGYTSHVFDQKSPPLSFGGDDSALAYSWKIDLRPYETVHKRVVFAIRAQSYYVSDAHGADATTNDGSIEKPFKTINYAINKIGNRKGFIYVVDYPDVSDSIGGKDYTIQMSNANPNADITINSTDITWGTTGADGAPTHDVVTIKRAAGYDGPMVNQQGGKLTVLNLKLDGNTAQEVKEPIAKVSGGTFNVSTGAELLNANNNSVTDATAGTTATGSAVDLTGSANFLMDGGKITGNKSVIPSATDDAEKRVGKGAVNYASSGTFTVENTVDITGNTFEVKNPANGATVKSGDANVYLNAGKSIEVNSDLGSSTIGVTSKDVPRASLSGSVDNQNQEVAIAKPTSAYLATLGGSPDVNSPFTSNFSTDDNRYTVTIGTKYTGSTSFNNLNYTVFQLEGKQINFVYVDEQGATIASATAATGAGGSGNPTSMLFAKGEQVTIPVPTAVQNYNLNKVEISPATAYVDPLPVPVGGPDPNPQDKLLYKDTLTSTDAGFAAINGHMPNTDVTVTYTYKKDAFKLKFDAKGGIPTPGEITGETGDAVSGVFPIVVKYGYNFVDWKVNGVTQTALPATFSTGIAPFNLTTPASKEVTYVANYAPDTSIKFDYKVQYSNADGSIVFLLDNTATGTSGKSVEATITAGRKNVPHYVWNEPSATSNPSNVDPSSYVFNDTSIGAPTFDTTSPHSSGNYGNFVWRMPGQATTVSYVYSVDTSQPRSSQPTLTVVHKSSTGTVLQTTTDHYYPEETITAAPISRFGYTLNPNGWHVTQSHGAGEDGGNLYSVAATENNSPNPFNANGVYTGKMPNQDVTIIYTYTGSGAGLEFSVLHQDNGAHDPRLKNIQFPAAPSSFAFANPEVTNPAVDSVVNAFPLAAPHNYGYLPITTAGSTHTASPVADPVTAGAPLFDASFNYSAKMPANDLQVTYGYVRDSSAWGTVKFYSGLDAVGGTEQATLANTPNTEVSQDVTANGTNSFKTDILKKNAAGQGFTFGDLKARLQVPKAVANDSVHYMVDGWFVDLNGNRIMDGSEQLLQDSDQFNGGEDIVAHIAENPTGWADINIGPYPDGHVTWNTGAPTTLHVWVDKPWSQIEPLADAHDVAGVSTPNYTGEVNYIRKGFVRSSDSHLMAATDGIANGETYLIKFTPDPVVFGLPVHPVDAGGSLDTQGKGVVTAYATKPGYKYIVVDPDGKVVGVENGNPAGRTYFNNLTPGTTYQVYEAEGDNTAQVGDDISNVPAPISAPSSAHVPAVDTNKQITYDPNDETKVNFTIDPADRDADYALIDENGNVVTTPETQADGWQAGTPGRITFSGLTPNKPYTVVVRPHGRNDITPLQKLPDGTAVVMDPGGEIDVPKFSITTTDGESEITTVNGNAINTNYFDEAHKDETVVLTAPATNSAGETFKAWRVTTGVIPGINSQLGNATLTFTMPDTNVVLTAYYNRNLNGNAPVTDEIRGGNSGEMALDPNEVPGLENQLTTPDDQVLMNVNHADVSYKVIYNKKNVPSSVATALKNDTANVEAANHPDAFTAAWEVQTNIERYVNGRLVPRPATGSNATFRTYVQLDKEDVNNLDYQLLREDPSNPGNFIPQTLTPVDVYASGGLFQFTAEEGVKYYLTYSKAYKVTWINNRDTVAPWPQYSFPVRKGDSPSDSDYTTQYNTVTNNEPTGAATHQVDPATGVEYDWKGWSRKADKFKQYDDTAPIKKRTIVYGYWEDNRQVVDDTRNGLEDAIKKALKLSDDFFLKRKETAALINGVPGVHTGINDAIAVFEKTGPRATAAELQQALDDLLDTIRRYDNTLNPRYNHYNQITNGNLSGGASGGGGGRGNGGRGGSGGGSGRGSSGGGGGTSFGSTAGGPSFIGKEAFIADYEQGYTVGTNGNWQLVNPEHSEWIFTLNGGIRLVSRWAKLDYANGDVNKNGWYHFNSHGIMDFGWFRDEKLDWYYCNTEHDGWLGKMKLGWHYDEADKHWYYLDPQTGVMHTGWTEINGKWYYFAPTTSANTYEYDAVNERWFYKSNSVVRPMGSMYQNETTPDGYRVDANGAWIH